MLSSCASQILACVLYPDLQVQRDCAFALANIADSVEYQNDVVREGGIEVLVKSGLSDDARVQRDTARAFSALTLPEHLKKHIIDKDALPTLFALARSLDVASQRYATLAICNLSAGDLKSQVRTLVGIRLSLLIDLVVALID